MDLTFAIQAAQTTAPTGITLLDARQYPQQYKALFCQYCKELSESDPTIAQYDPNALAEENLQTGLDHPYLIEAEGEMVGLVVFMEEETRRSEDSCHSYLGELFVRKPYRNRGIAGKIAGAFLEAQPYDVGLCYVRGSTAETFWRNAMARFGYDYETFEEDEIRDFIHIRLRHRAKEHT